MARRRQDAYLLTGEGRAAALRRYLSGEMMASDVARLIGVDRSTVTRSAPDGFDWRAARERWLKGDMEEAVRFKDSTFIRGEDRELDVIDGVLHRFQVRAQGEGRSVKSDDTVEMPYRCGRCRRNCTERVQFGDVVYREYHLPTRCPRCHGA